MGVALALEAGFALATLALRHSWARLFTDDAAVVALTASLLPVFALSLPGDGANATLQGLLRGSGRQETGAATNLCSYWLLGIPSAAFLAFRWAGRTAPLWVGLLCNRIGGINKPAAPMPARWPPCRCHLGVHGLWWGLVIVNTVQGTVMLVIAARFNYAREAAKAAARVAAHRASEGGGGLHEPLLGGPQCERLEAGLAAAPLLDPAGPVEEELPAGQVLADAGMADGTAAE